MLITKREVKHASKKLLSMLLSLVMIMTSMSVCFGTFVVTSAAADEDYTQQLADKLKDSEYAGTIGILAGGSDTGSGTARKLNISFTDYKNFKQAAELLRLVDSAMKETEGYIKCQNNPGGQQSSCGGATTAEVCQELITNIGLKGCTPTDNIKKFLELVYTADGAVTHDNATSTKNNVSDWSNTVTFTTTDYKGYLAQIGKAANVEASIELGVQYKVSMLGNAAACYSVAGDCGSSTAYYHNFIHPSAAINAPSTFSTNTEAKTKVNEHINYLNSLINLTYDELLAMANANTLDAKLKEYSYRDENGNAVGEKEKMIDYVGSTSTYDALFADYAKGIANFLSSAESAKNFKDYMPTVDDWNDFVDANPNYGVYQYDNFGPAGSDTQVKLVEDFATFKAYRDYLLGGGSIYTYLVDNNYIDETYYTNFYDNVVAYDLQASKDKADALYNTYKDNYADLETAAQTIVYSELCGYINAIGTYSSQVVNSVYTEGYQYLIELRESLKCEINEAVFYFAENADKTFTTLSTSALWSKINEARGKKAELDALYNEVSGNVGSARADELLQTVKNSATVMIENLYKTLADRFTLEVNNAWDVYVELGKPTALKVDSFLKLSAVMVSIEPDILTDLQTAGKAGYITQETINRYNELMKVGGIYEIWNAYATTYGFPDYKQTQIQYDDRQSYDNDMIKTGTDPVTEEEMNNLIAALDTIITSDTVGSLLGGLLNPDAEAGADFDLGAMLTDLVKGMLFTDDFVNTVVQMLYPLVLNEFAKVWAGLPQSVTVNVIVDINVTVRYVKSLNNILDEGNFGIYPNLLAGKLSEINATKYADNIRMLNAAGDRNNSWESPEIVDYDTGKLKLSWGIDEQKEKLDAGDITQAQFDAFFYQAFEDATSGLLPLLTTLITNKAWTPDKNTKIATGSAPAVTVDVDLQLGSTPNRGYANMLVPIYELLGVPYTPVSTIESAEHNSDVSYLLEQILAPIFAFLDKLGDKPVDTILSILPNLVYALAFRMVKPMLNMLKTQITYDASTSLTGSVMADGADVAVGDMLIGYEEDKLLNEGMFVGGLNSLLEFFGLSIPAIDQATLATLGSLDQISTQRADYIYSGLAGTGKAYSITADKADVGYYLLQYILGILKDDASLTSILGLFMTQKDENGEAILDADGNSIPDEEAIAALKETLYNDEGLNFDAMNVGDAIAAVVELANQIDYVVPGYQWFAPENPGMTPAIEHYLNPNNDWTKDKAEYLYDNLESLLGSILSMANVDLDKETEEVDGSIEGILDGAINGLFTNETVTALAKLLGGLDLNALLSGDADAEEADEAETLAEGEEGDDATEEAAPAIDLNKIIKDELGIDLSVYAQYKDIADDYDWGVTDAETFVDALTDLLAPLQPVLDFILAGKDLTLLDSAITLQGYKGYDNAIIPLLEALGATPAAYTDGADTLKLTLNALVGVINKLTTNDPEVEKDGAIYTIIDMLPGILYYLSSNALSQGIEKLLYPVYELLDTIRPIYDLDLAEMIAGIEVDLDGDGEKEALGEDLGLDIDNIGVGFVLGLLNKLVGLDLDGLNIIIYDVCKVIATEYDSASSLESTWKKGVYSERFDQADMLTVVLSFLLEWITDKNNAEALDELLGTDGLVASISEVFAGVEIEYKTPNWLYWFDNDPDAFDEYMATGGNLPVTLAALTYPNDWTPAAAEYIADNISYLADEVVALVTKDDEATVSALLNDLIDDYITADTINDLVGLIGDVLGDIDENLIDLADVLLGVDILGLKDYECTKEINSISDFADELAYILDTYAGGLVDWIFFGDDYGFASTSEGADQIVINGGKGYEKALALILEAIGCEDLPDEEDATVYNVLGALATRVEEILANPVDEILDLVPNLTYFLNANGLGVSINNLLAPVNALLGKLEGLGVNISLSDLIKFTVEDEEGNEVEYTLDLTQLSLANVVEVIELLTKLDLAAVDDVLVNFCAGKITAGKFIYKLDAPRKDVITVLLTVALMFVEDEKNAKDLDEMLGTEIVSALKTVFESVTINYESPNWNYPLAANGTVDAMKYSITYPNNWTEATAEYVTDYIQSEEFDALIAGLIDSNYTSLRDLLNDKVNVFTSENLQSIVDLITDLLKDIDSTLLETAGLLLGADIAGLKDYKAPEGITTVDAFAAELANVLNTYAKGVVEWLLLGEDYEFFVADADGKGEGLEGETIITIDGAEGYAEGLALLLEALGCEDLPDAYDETLTTEEIISGVLASLANRINAIFDNPVEEVFNLLPNLIYFLNTNGIAVVVKNTTAALTALSIKLETFVDISLDVTEMVDLKSLMGLEDTDAKISMNNLTMAAILEAVSLMTGIDITYIEDILNGFALGQVNEYDSVSKEVDTPKKMSYKDEFDKHDMATVLANIVLITLDDEDNAEFVEDLVGEDINDVIVNVFDMEEIPVQAFDWQFTEQADTGYVFSAIDSSELYSGFMYGPLYTEEMAQYIGDNFGDFVDNIIYLLGIQINGKNVDTLEDLLKGLVNGSLYNSENVIAIRDALAGVLAGIGDLEVNGKNVGKHIVAVLKTAGIADLDAVAKVEVPEFTEDREQFVTSLCDVIEPLYPILKWVLADEDISFFVDTDKKDLITLKGAEGYAYGIIPLLEALDCEGILTPAEYYDAVDADGDVLLTSILTPLLDRVDVIMEAPADEILNMLPNLVYFINSNGVDTVVKNTLNAVYALLRTIEPIAKIDLYKLIGIDLATIDFNWLFDKLLEIIYDATGYKFDSLDANAILELTVGELESYTSKNELTAYKMVYANAEDVTGGRGEMATVVMRLLVTFILHENNREMFIGLLEDYFGMSEDAHDYVSGVLASFASLITDTYLGMDQALATLYYLFYGADIGTENTATGLKDINAEWQKILKELGKSDDPNEMTIGNMLANFLNIYMEDIFTEEGIAPNGFISFFQRIIDWFQRIIDWFRNLFS